MFKTLYARLALALVSLLAVVGVIFALIIVSATQRYTQEITQQFNRELARNIVADRNLISEGRLDMAALKKTFSLYMDINPSIEIYLLDLEGRILSFSADPGKVKRRRVDLEPIRAYLRREGFPLLGDDPRSHDRRKAFSVTPVPSANQVEGYLYVVLQGEEYDSVVTTVQENFVFRLSAWSLAAALGFGLLAGLLLFYGLTRRLRRLNDVLEDFQQSDFNQHRRFSQSERGARDEIDGLGLVFDEMSDRMISQLQQLRGQDKTRRELVAQISHDLRTPLAVLHGYLETLSIKGDAVTNADRNEYVSIALRQSSHLKRMVEQLFELAQLEARDARPKTEPVSIPELLQDVFLKFQKLAQEKEIRMQLDAPKENWFAEADVALLERLLDNLVGNAVEYTPAGGNVRMCVHRQDDFLRVSVEDSGPGIPEADLSRIFEAFYRRESKNSDNRHVGLGLAIANRIARLHSGKISASNRVEGGAKFDVDLPLWRDLQPGKKQAG